MRRAVVVLLLAVLVSACDSEPAPPPAFADARALADAAAAGTIAAGSAKFNTDVSAGTVKSKGQGQARFVAAGTSLAMTTDFVGEPLDLRLVDKTLYAKVPEGSQLGDGKPWVKVSPDGSDPFSQVLGGSLAQLAQQNDPARTLDEIRSAGTIAASERTTFDGVGAEHYRVDIDLAKLGTALPAGLSAEAVAQLHGKVGGFPVELWLDDTRRPLQIVVDLSPILTASGAPDGASARITAHYTEWGAAVDVQAPAADQVGQLTGG